MDSININIQYNYKVTVEFEILGPQEYRFIQDPSDNAVLASLRERGYTVTIEKIEEEI